MVRINVSAFAENVLQARRIGVSDFTYKNMVIVKVLMAVIRSNHSRNLKQWKFPRSKSTASPRHRRKPNIQLQQSPTSMLIRQAFGLRHDPRGRYGLNDDRASG
jgi:hypothetical protein